MTRGLAVPAWMVALLFWTGPSQAMEPAPGTPLLTGQAAFGGWQSDRPGVRRHITGDALPPPYATRPAWSPPRVVARPEGASPKVPEGFEVSLLAAGLDDPRGMRVAPNGDVLVSEMGAGRIRLLRPKAGGDALERIETFAEGLSFPFGMAFHPPGPDPQWLYVANTNAVVRFPYRIGDTKARAGPQVVVPDLPDGGHATRDIAFTLDGKRMLVSVGSASNVGEGMGSKTAQEAADWDRAHGIAGAAWGFETTRAAVLAFSPEGRFQRIFATGLRNCVGLAVDPATGMPWCSTNERDGLGDDLVPDYLTSVREGGFYGWPWYYIGCNEDPRRAGERPDLKDKVIVPDVLLQAHSASLQLTFYDGRQFPPDYRGSIFAAEHGSWNRSQRTGYKIVRALMKDGAASGTYEDFMTGFVVDGGHVWGRPVGVAVARDGSLLVSEDGNGTIWRVTYRGTPERN